MTDARCDPWNPVDCEGSPHCPPRCPRFVDSDGVFWLVRPFEPGDRESLLDTYRDFDPGQRAQGLPPADEGRLADWLDGLIDEGCNFVAARDGVIAGHAAYTPTDAAEPELAVFVHQDYQGRGLGTELCRHVVATAAAADRDGLELVVRPGNETAVGIYERLGFERDEPDELDERATGNLRRTRVVRMRLSLSSPAVRDARFPPALRERRA